MMNKKYKFFWSGIYSNWYNAPFLIGGVSYNCVEQYMMAQKALVFNDLATYDKIMSDPDPRTQKRLGRKVKDFNPEIWNNVSYGVVFAGCMAKFTQNITLETAMLAEGCDFFVEASPYDKIWGIGFDEANAMENIENWGENRLGQVLTDVRNCLC